MTDTHDGSATQRASEDLLPVVYNELRRLARAYMASERANHSLDATALVHEAYLRLADGTWRDRTHFFRASARAMRRLLIEHARHRARAKRGGDWQRVSFANAEAMDWGDGLSPETLLALDQALDKLEQLDARYVRVVELRFFASLKLDEVAETLGVSKRTAEGDWAFARSWLRREMARNAAS